MRNAAGMLGIIAGLMGILVGLVGFGWADLTERVPEVLFHDVPDWVCRAWRHPGDRGGQAG